MGIAASMVEAWWWLHRWWRPITRRRITQLPMGLRRTVTDTRLLIRRMASASGTAMGTEDTRILVDSSVRGITVAGGSLAAEGSWVAADFTAGADNAKRSGTSKHGEQQEVAILVRRSLLVRIATIFAC